jgi:hypothetical protein
MNGLRFREFVSKAFEIPLGQLGFKLGTVAVSGRSYSAEYLSERNVVSVSYEPGDEFLLVLVFGLSPDGTRSDIDDPVATPRLNELNRRFAKAVSQDERVENQRRFASFEGTDVAEDRLLKAAKDLRLVLPLYLSG